MGKSQLASSSDTPLVEHVAEEILARQRAGEQPTVEEYCQRYPEHAEQLRSFLPAIMVVEGLKPGSMDASGTFGGTIDIAGKPREKIGDYRILRELGRGGMGIVYEAEQQSLGRHVALKVLLRSIAGDAKGAKRFESEARAAARMHHTNIVPVFDVGSDDEHMFYAMQLIQGQAIDLVIDDLKVLRQASSADVKRNGPERRDKSIARSLVSGEFQQHQLVDDKPDVSNDITIDTSEPEDVSNVVVRQPGSSSVALPWKADLSSAEGNRPAYFLSVARIGHQTADALDYAHARGIIHRDIKPSNLLLDGNGIVWITDFGLAKTGDHGMTHTGDILGTIRYMSPERFQGQCDVRADVYSLGLTLYELLTLQPAFSASDQLKLIDTIVKTEPTTPRSIDASVPGDLETIVLKCIDKDARRRYQSAHELRDDLERFINDEPIKARRVSLFERSVRWSRRNKGIAFSLAVAAVLLLIINIAGPLMTWRMASLKNAAVLAEGVANKRADTITKNLYIANMNLGGHLSTATGTIRRIQDLTEPWIPDPGQTDLRGWEWCFLRSRLHQDLHTVHIPSLRNRYRIAQLSPSGKQVATLRNSALLVTDAINGKLFAKLAVTEGPVPFCWHPDEKQLTFVSIEDSNRYAVHLWDIQSGRQISLVEKNASFSFGKGLTGGIAWSPDGAHFAYADADGTYILDARSGESFSIPYPSSRLAWSHDGRRLARRTFEGIQIWDIASRTKERFSLDGQFWRTFVWSPDDTKIAGSSARTVHVWDLDGKSPLRECSGHSAAILDVCWSADGQQLASSADDHTIRIWNPQSGHQDRVLHGHSSAVVDLVWREGGQIVSVGAIGTVKTWSGANLQPPALGEGEITTSAWNPNPRKHMFVSASRNGSLQGWDALNHRLLYKFRADAYGQRRVSFSPDGQYIAAGNKVGFLQFWNVETGQFEESPFPQHDSQIYWVEWSPIGDMIAVADQSGNLEIWGIDLSADLPCQSLQLLHTWTDRSNLFRTMDWTRDGRFLAAGQDHGSIHIWNVETDDRSQMLGHEAAIMSVSWSPDNQSLVACYRDGTSDAIAAVWDVEQGEERFRLTGHANTVLSVDWSPDGSRIASSSRDTSIKIWDAHTGREMMTLNGHDAFVSSVEWNHDGTCLVSSDADGVTKIWDARKGYAEGGSELQPTARH